MLPIAQGNALGKRRPRLIHSAFLRLRKNATRRKRVTHYALNATRGVAPHKAGCSYRARHFNQCNIVSPGRCPGLSAAIGLTARHTCAANAVKSCIYMNDLLFVRLVRPTRSPFYPLKEISVNFLIFSAALGIARTSSALHSLARKFALRLVGENNHGRKQIAGKILSFDKNQINLTFS